MSRPSTVNLKGFYDAIGKGSPLLYDHQFIIEFGGDDLPSYIKKGPEDSGSITYYVKSSKIPKVTIQETTVNFLSQDFVIPKQVTYDETWNVNVLVNQDMTHYKSLYEWQREYARLELSGGGRKIIPSITAHVGLLDSTLQQVVRWFTLEGVFPSNIPDLSMQYENAANLVDFNCTFTYQYVYDEADGDPLKA